MSSRLKLYWYHIVLPLTTWVYLSALLSQDTHLGKALFVAGLMGVVMLTAATGYLLNDLFDRQKDKIAGKTNFFNQYPRVAIPAAIMVLVATITLWIALWPSAMVLWLLGLQAFLLLAYSLPGIRLKESFAGLWADALYSRVVPATVLILLGGTQFTFFSPYFWVSLWLWLGIAGLRNIILHQIDDRHKDRKSGTNTWVLRFGVLAASKVVYSILLPLELLLMVVWGLVAWSVLPEVVVVCVFAFLVVCLCNLAWEPPPHNARWWKRRMLYLPNTVYEEWLPAFGLFLLAIESPWLLLIALVHLLIFGKAYLKYFMLFSRALSYSGHKLYLLASRIVNYSIYYGFRLFKVDLKKENISALDHLRKNCNN